MYILFEWNVYVQFEYLWSYDEQSIGLNLYICYEWYAWYDDVWKLDIVYGRLLGLHYYADLWDITKELHLCASDGSVFKGIICLIIINSSTWIIVLTLCWSFLW